MNIGVIGSEGVVGSAVSDGLERIGHNIFRHDIKLSTTIYDLMEFQPEICFICVPTPQLDDGSCDVSIVEEVVKSLAERQYNGIIAIKSTVEPGTTVRLHDRYRWHYDEHIYYYKRLKIAFVPEFLRERSAFHDFTEGHDLCIIGTLYEPQADYIFSKLQLAHGKYPEKFIHLSATEAEISKYYSNVFNALRVIFANAFYELCQKLGANYTEMKNAVVSRNTITDMYLDVNENLRGYAGVCLSKDCPAIANLAKRLGLDAKIFQTIVEDNELYRPTVPEGMRKK